LGYENGKDWGKGYENGFFDGVKAKSSCSCKMVISKARAGFVPVAENT